MTHSAMESFFIEEMFKLENKEICLLILHCSVDNDYQGSWDMIRDQGQDTLSRCYWAEQIRLPPYKVH